MDYPDTNSNGIPDAFENRPSISEVLNSHPADAVHKRDLIDVPEDDGRDYRLYFGPYDRGRTVVLLEVGQFGLYRRERGACVFKSREELQKLQDALQEAADKAYG